jgi:hypothetical protein
MRINKSNEKLSSLTESFLKDDKPIANVNLDNSKKSFNILNKQDCALNNDDNMDKNINQTVNENKILNKKVPLSEIFPNSIFSGTHYYKSHIRLCKKVPPMINTEKVDSREKLKCNTESNAKKEINERPEPKAQISEFKKILFSNNKKMKNNNSIIYKKKSVLKNKSIMKNKSNVGGHKRNRSMNYYIIPKFKENQSMLDLNEKKIIIKVKPHIKKLKNACTIITKININNKKEELDKIIYIQKMWKKIMIEKQFKPIIYDYKELVTYLPNSFYYNPKKPYQEIINNISNSSNISNNLNSIMSYTNHKEDNLGNYYKKLNGIKMMPSNITLHKKRKNIDISAFPINPKKENVKNRLYNSLKYKAVNNINNTFSYNYSNTYNNNIYNYNYKSPRPSSLRVKKCVSNTNTKSQNNSKSKNKFSMTNIVMVKNKLNKWIKNKIEFNYVPHSINKYKKLMPNKNFIMIISHKKEKRLFLYNEDKAVVQKPKIKKNKLKSNALDDLNINENNLRRSLASKNKTYKVNKKHRIIKQYFIDDNNEVEPSLNLENKLIMKKPILHKINQ